MHRFIVERNPDEKDIYSLSEAIQTFNVNATGIPLQKDISCLLRDQSDAIVAGVYASVWGNVCNIKGLWVHEAHRRKGLGKQLLELVEQEALAYGCTLLTIFPYSFQEPKFYQLQGFEFAGVIEDSPFPHKLYFLQKNLASQ